MPLLEPVVLEARSYSFRLVGPEATIWPVPQVKQPTFAVLNNPTMVARELPMSNTPNSPDFVSGTWSGRINDAGDFALTFPNKEASDGVAWRNRFDPFGKNQWIEIRNGGYLEMVGCIEKVDIKRDSIEISGHDGWWQLKGAYERDWIALSAPRDVINRGTKVWVPVIRDDFPNSGTTVGGGHVTTPYHTWTDSIGSGATITVAQPPGGLQMSSAASTVNISVTSSFATAGDTWIATLELPVVPTALITFAITESSGDIYEILFQSGTATTVSANLLSSAAGSAPGSTSVPAATTYTLQMESDGMFVWGFLNGALIGCLRRIHAFNNSITPTIQIQGSGSAAVTIGSVIVRVLQPYLIPSSSDFGDYVLPGTGQTYPYGGLHGRYFNNADISADPDRLYKINSPTRTQVYAGSGTAEYSNRQDAVILGGASLEAPLPGVSSSAGVGQYWSAVWFGSIYLKLSAGNYSMNLQTGGPGLSVRVWIGQTDFGQQVVDQWVFNTSGTHNYGFTISASNLGGTKPYDQSGTVVKRDGWYPIKIEYAVDSTFASGPTLQILNSPAAYTDPGGTAIASGAQTTTVPSTSLSPLGCVDQRYQGVSHFDLVQQTIQAFGYQASVEPHSLESSLFPGILAPRIHEGYDYDAILEPDDYQHTEGLTNYGNTLDATDSVDSLLGNGAGFQNGTQGQLQAIVSDIPTLDNTLFDIQGWQDFSDASFPSLLQGLLNSQLGLRLQPWQIVTGDPLGRQRLANTWPLPSSLAEFRWRPGDGIRIYARDIKLQDILPRQLLLVTRQINPNGTTATQVGMAQRPRTGGASIKQAMFQASRWQRNYQRQLVTLTGGFCQNNVAAGSNPTAASSVNATPALSLVQLWANDIVVRATFRVSVNNLGMSYKVFINGTDRTTALGGPWVAVPINLNVTQYAVPNSDNRIWAYVQNAGGSTSEFDFQILVDVLR